MAATNPYDQIVGVLQVYIAPYGTAEPAVTGAPGTAWAVLGCTDGDLTEEHGVGDLVKFYDNCSRGPVKAVMPQQDPTFAFTLVSLTLENIARVIAAGPGSVVTSGSTKRLPVKRAYEPAEWALLARSESGSAYGNLASQLYIPRGVFDLKLSLVYGKTTRAGLAVTYHALEDAAQSEMDRLGWKSMATA